MSYGRAALRGAAAAALWAAVTVTLLANTVGGAIAGTTPPRTGLGAFAQLLLAVLAVMVTAAVPTGAILGLVSLRVALVPPLRVALLAVVAVPALLFVLGAACTVGSMGAVPVPRPSFGVWTPGVGWSSRIATATVAGVLLVPAGVTLALLEGWTRPATVPQTSLARPEVRRWVIWGLVALAVVLGSVAVARAAYRASTPGACVGSP